MPIDLMAYQCEPGLNLKAVEWTREWIARIGDEKLK